MKKNGKERVRRWAAGLLAALTMLAALPAQEARAASQSDGIAVQQVSTGEEHTAVVKADGSLWIWGNNSYGQLGTGDKERQSAPRKIMDDVKSVSLGEGNSSAALKKDGSLWMWGFNYYGQLGTGDKTDRSRPVKVLTGVKSVTLGHSCGSAAIRTDGSLWMWGWNNSGRLGTGDDVDITTPKKVMENVASVALGQNHAAVVKTDGSLWTWGSNVNGQLGNGENGSGPYYEPQKIMDGVRSVSASRGYSAAVKTDGSLWTWGGNNNGRLGLGEQVEVSRIPRKIMENVKSVSLADASAAAVKEDGSLWTWGLNYRSQLGTGDVTNRFGPERTLTGVAQVSMARLRGGAVKKDGTLWMWGTGSAPLGISGAPDLAAYPTPFKVPVPGNADPGTSDKPGMPQMKSVSNTASGITVRWAKVSKATGYCVYRRTGSGKWTQIAKVRGIDTLSYSDKSVKTKNGTVYTYSVCAYNNKATGTYSKIGKTIMRLTAPTLSGAANNAAKKVRVTWKKNAKAAGYQIQYAASGDFTGAKTVKVTPAKTTAATLTKMAKGKTYHIRIRSYKKSGGVTSYSAWSGSKKVRIKR